MVMHVMIYDCFPLCWELDLLEIRLNTLDRFVDYFVIAESPWLRSGKLKPLYYGDAADDIRFAKFKHKIIHVVEDRPPEDPVNRNTQEWRQKNIVKLGLIEAKSDDLIFASDADELWNPIILDNVIKKTKVGPCYLDHQLHYYFFNCQIMNGSKYSSNVAFACRYKDFTNVQNMRRRWRTFQRIRNSGWHFAYLMSPEGIREKVRNLGVAKYRAKRFQDLDHIRKCMGSVKDLYNRKGLYNFKLNLIWKNCDIPSYIKDNRDQFKKYFYPGGPY